MGTSRRSRRSFIQFLGLNGLAAAAGSCGPSALASAGRVGPHVSSPTAVRVGGLLRLDSNENSSGPGPRVLDAVQNAFGGINRYAFAASHELTGAISRQLDVEPDQIELGCGSSEILDAAVSSFTSPDRALVTASPTFELPANLAHHLGHSVVEVPVTDRLTLDLDRMAERAHGAGLFYVCNPNNPTATLHGASAIEQFVADALKREPTATILIDEAYHEYVERADYRTAVPIALANPRVIVSRTFSKIFGLAGMRIGYAVGQRPTLAALSKRLDSLRISCLTTAAALAALEDPSRISEQRTANHEARAFTIDALKAAGYEPVASEANFLMVDVRRDIRSFQAACRDRGVSIARPFPPLTTYARITIGTMDEMKRATAVFQEVLAQPASAACLEPLRREFWRRDARDRAC
jgi:histidinol-phosphate aminotransferase